MTSQLVSSSSVAASRAKLLQYELSPHIKEKILTSTKKDTEFYDIAQPYHVLRKLNVRVTPQLEEVDFYSGGRIPDQYDYAPMSVALRWQLHKQRSGRERRKVELSQILNNFDEGQICFVGPAGSGKTTLLKAISRDVMEGKYEKLKEVEIVHFVKCRDFRATDKVTPAELLFRNVNPELNKNEMNGSLLFAKHNPKKVFFVIDSLDTLPYTLDGKHDVIGLHEEASPATILWNLLTNKLLPGCRCITSREHTIRKYEGDFRANKVIALAGLTEESMKEIITGYLDEKEADEIMSYLKEKAPVLMSLCSTPVFLTFTLIGFKMESEFTPSTMSGIMILLLQSLLHSPHAHAENIEDVINKLKELAFTGTQEGRVLFQTHELQQYVLEPADLTITVPGGWKQKVLEGGSLLFFCHQSIQETLTALHIAEMELEEFKSFTTEHLHTPHYYVIRRILCGILLDEDVMEASQQLLSVKENLDEKQTHLRTSLQQELRERRGREEFSDMLELFISIHEARNGMKDVIKSSLDIIELCDLPLSISDVHAIGSVIHHCNHLERVSLNKCSLNPATVKVLASAVQGSDVEISKLDLSDNRSLDASAMSTVGELAKQCRVDTLVLALCNLTSDYLEKLKLSLHDYKISKLNLSGNRSLDASAMSTVGELAKQCQVDTLVLSYCNLTSEHLEMLKLSLQDYKIQKLVISYSFFKNTRATHDEILAVIDFFSFVTEELSIKGWVPVQDEDLQLLQYKLDQLYPTKLKVVGTGWTFTSHRPIIEESNEVLVRHKSKTIGEEGGKIEIDDSSLDVSRGCLTKKTELSFTIKIAKSYPDLPQRFNPLGPRIICKPGGTVFAKAGTFKVTIWRHLIASEQYGSPTSVKVLTKKVGPPERYGSPTSFKVLTKKVGDGNWREIEKDVVVNKDGTIEFPCEHFCKFAPVIDVNSNAPYRFGYFLCRDYENTFVFVYFLFNETLEQNLLKKHESFIMVYPPVDKVNICPGEKLSVKLTAHTAGFHFIPAVAPETTINETTDKSNSLRIVLEPNDDLSEQLQSIENRVTISFHVNEKENIMNVRWYPSNQPSTSAVRYFPSSSHDINTSNVQARDNSRVQMEQRGNTVILGGNAPVYVNNCGSATSDATVHQPRSTSNPPQDVPFSHHQQEQVDIPSTSRSQDSSSNILSLSQQASRTDIQQEETIPKAVSQQNDQSDSKQVRSSPEAKRQRLSKDISAEDDSSGSTGY